MSEKIVIIGSGPAGLAAAVSLRRHGIAPVIVERLGRPAMKLLASGGGRCNFSNALGPEDFMRRFGRNGAFMRDALRAYPREKLLELLRAEHVRTELADGFHYFPASGKASDVADAFLRASGAEVRTDSEAVTLETADGAVTGIVLGNREKLPADAVILAAGGCAWAGLGTDAGLKLAEQVGHTVVKPLPAVAPLTVREDWVGKLAGLTLPDAELSLRSGRETLVTQGSLLFTHNGFSGFPALDLAGEASALCDRNGTAELHLRSRTDMDAAAWEKVFGDARRESGSKLVRTVLHGHLPRSLAETAAELCNCFETKAANLSAEAKRELVRFLTACPLTLTGAGPMDRAMAMRGGISLKEVDPAALSSRKVRGLYFAGEILDLAGPCGGYNMQWAFSSGFFAGENAARSLKSKAGKGTK
ncbi:MAG: aminoacetone oxidase family FAD-binding enzyme [Lentisphaeria bacterium]|nr:aminoacetone oxidase family FAD-binding enzyme [Lentisphaeria bacterium]